MLLILRRLFRELVVVSAAQATGLVQALQADVIGGYHRPRQTCPAWAFAPEMPQSLHRPDTRVAVSSCGQRRDLSRRNARNA